MQELKLAVIGDPIEHSISPEMHSYWFKMHNIMNAHYDKIRIPKVYLLSFFKKMAEEGFLGVNVTLPLKEEAYYILKEIGKICPLAEKVKAINTVVVRDGELYGYNTDVSGFYDSLVRRKPSNYELSDKSVLIIGAGGAARGVAAAFATNGYNKIVIANRSIDKANKLKEDLLSDALVIGLDKINNVLNKVDIVVNTVSVGIISGKKLEIDFSKSEKELICYDIVYKPYFTDFLQQAKEHGHFLIHGIDMLVGQGALSFKEWFNEKPEITNELLEYLIRL